MEGNRRNFLSKRSNLHFEKIGGPSKRTKHSSFYEEHPESFHSSETVYRILCLSKRIGSVIGKGGNIVKALREETQAKITVSDSAPGLDERVIIIYSSDKQAKRQRGNNGFMVPHCAAQDALLKVHDRIVEEDLVGAQKSNGDEVVVTARLLVSENAVGCILGRKGDVIQRLRSETGANIRVLSTDLPACAMSSDELVQISGRAAIAKKALYEVSTLLHQNPRKDTHSQYPTPFATLEYHPPGPLVRNVPPPRNSGWLERNDNTHRLRPMHYQGEYEIYPSQFGPEDFDCFTPPHDREAPSEFSMKILCLADRIGVVIGKGGSNVRQLEQETGASIHVENVSQVSDEKAIRVSSFEALGDQRSQTISAILYLQDKTSNFSDKGTITTRLLVPSIKVGCILGQGGHVINDMRRRIRADIRVLSKEDKPKCASEDEELVQISGSSDAAKEALVEIAQRLRTRYLHDANTRVEPAPMRRLPEFSPTENLHGDRFHLSNTVGAGSSGRYEHLQGGIHEFEPPSFPVHPHATRYLDVNEAKIPSVSTTGVGRMTEFTRARVNFLDPYAAGPDFDNLERYSSPPQRSTYLSVGASSAGRDNYDRAGVYDGYDSPQGVYPNSSASPVPYHNPALNHRPTVYAQRSSLENIRAHGSYQY